MSIVTDPIALAVGNPIQVPTPQNVGQLDSVTMANLSGLVLKVLVGSNQYYQSPWSEDRYQLSGSDRIQILASQPSGTAPDGTSEQLNCTWFVKGERPIGTWPLSLVANALAATISGGTIVLEGTVPVINGPQPGPSVPLDVDGTVSTEPLFNTLGPTVSHTLIGVTGTAVQLPVAAGARQGTLVKALKANANPVYIGPAGVTAANGYELLPGDATGPILVANAALLFVNGTAGDGVAAMTL